MIGADNWVSFDKWDRYEEILEKFKVLVYPRSGYDTELPTRFASSVTMIEAPLVELSSTEIREGLKMMKNMC